MATPTADSLLDLERRLEADIIDCLTLLEQGRDDALRELRSSLRVVGTVSNQVAERLLSTTSDSLAHVQAVQRELGNLNLAMNDFVLTDSLTMESLKAFDAWRDRVLLALQNARGAIAAMGDKEHPWSDELEETWLRFRQRLELVHAHLESDESAASADFALQRKALFDRVSDLRGKLLFDPKGAREALHQLSTGDDGASQWRRLDGWIKALLMWRTRENN
jgi:hypothetical protein